MHNAINQLVIAVVSGARAGILTDRLTRERFYVTRMDSWGGILDEPSVSLIIGLEGARLPQLLALLRRECRRQRRLIPAQVEVPLLDIQPPMVEAEVGGASIYVLDVERFERL